MSSPHQKIAADRAGKVLGQSVARLEDRPLVTGKGRYAADIGFPHQLYMRVVRAPQAHARIVSVEAEEARALPGVVAVWSHRDITDLPVIDFRDATAESLRPYRQPLLAADKMRYVGEPVAVVFATDPYVAEDAADLVMIEAEDLPVILDARDPPGEFAPGLSTEPAVIVQGYGDTAAAFAKAHKIVEIEVSVGRHTGVPLETRGALGRYDAAFDMLELYGAAKVPHKNRETIARYFDRPTTSVQLYEGHTGGGFGVRGELYPEDFLVLAAAMRLGRPVKWIEDRREHLMACNHSREQFHKVRAAVDENGVVTAMDDEFHHSQGGYIRTHGVRVLDNGIGMLPGCYRIPNFKAVGHFRLTNKTPAATYRSPGRYEGTFVRERMMDAIGDAMGLDKVEIRRRNLLPPEALPLSRGLSALGTDVVLDSGDYPKLLEKALKRFGWEDVKIDLKRRRAAGELVGFGISTFVEKSGLGPADGVKMSVDTSGYVELLTGSASVGQGVETTLAQITAEALGVDYRKVRVVHGQTDRIAHGIGAHASRATVMTGSATHVAALKLRDIALATASKLLQLPAQDLDIVDGEVVRKGDGPENKTGPSINLGTIAAQMAPGSPHLDGRDPGLACEGWFHASHMTYPYGMHLAQVAVDRWTGQVAIEKYLIAYDVGRAVNPAMIDGQISGGFVQGLGGALFEEFLYDERGEPLSVTFADYLIPTLKEVPALDILLTEDCPSPLNPLGLKGAGEGGCTGVGGCIAGAVDDALGIPGAIDRLPITPQRVLEALEKAGR